MTTRMLIKQLFTTPISLIGIVLISIFILVAIFAPLIAPSPPRSRDPYEMPRDGYSSDPQPPSSEHLFGTTEGQYDIFYGVVWGTRTAFKAGLIVTSATVAIGLLIGTIAAYYGGKLDEVLMRIVEIFMAFPFLLAAITMAAVLQPKLGRGIWAPMVALIVFGWTSYARLIRGDILSIKEREYVQAARIIGASDTRIVLKHILPNAIFPTMVVASMDIGTYVLSFAALSFLGVGVQVGYSDWGQIISFARNWIPVLSKYWFIIVYPGIAITLFVLAWNLVGDAFRDILDPRMRGAR
ncbi:MAG: peptide ABC transporter permease [Chloroflexi bacterium RBG_16_48_8]|nr:MAG: peptide ABC transporter permease [Chloroflexi bacterium RBG_16_48_8]